jgi:anthranilate synthase/aminodeoxychorismate synthase-like glutamine amidotransferase
MNLQLTTNLTTHSSALLLLIDNYDSFVFNLARHFERLGRPTRVVRNDAIDAAAVRAMTPSAIVISPGPCTPNEAGATIEIIRELHRELPMLGVCLGHQAIAQALGGSVVRASEPVHGRSSQIFHDERGLFAGIPNPTIACRYHSLIVERESLPPPLAVTASLDDGTIMALAHCDYPVFGVQFHPESILTESGYRLLANFLELAGCSAPTNPDPFSTELSQPQQTYQVPATPVTF